MGSMDVDKNNAAKRTQAFLENCGKSKTRKVDLEGHLARKKAEKYRHENCVADEDGYQKASAEAEGKRAGH